MTTAQHDPRRAERPIGVPLALGTRPLVVAPMAGGPTTPELVAAACNAGAFGVLDGASRSAESLAGCLRATRALTDRGFGVNLFVPRKPDLARDEPAVARYAAQLEAEALQYRVAPLPAPDFDLLPSWAGRVGELIRDPVALVSTTFGCPSRELVDALHRVGTSVAVTVTSVAEAECAAVVGADALVVQGCEAGGHRGVHSVRSTPNELTTLHLLGPVAEVGLPMIAAGGIAGPDDVRRVLDAGAVAAQCGTMFLRSHEAGTNDVWRAELRAGVRDTTTTRAFSGRVARGLANEFIRRHDHQAPPVYPQVDQLTRPIRSASVAAGDAESFSLWAGVGYRSGRDLPASEIIDWLCSGL